MTAPLKRRDLDAHRFPAAQCEALFQAVLIDDEVDAETPLPDHVTLDHGQPLLIDGFRLCRQLWIEGVERAELLQLLNRLARERDLGPADRLRFKYARAKLKHLRFACALYRADHRYPPVMNAMTTAFGHLQDAFKNGQRGRVMREAWLCRAFLAAPVQAVLRREHDRLLPTGTAGFRRYLAQEVGGLEAALAHPTVTGVQFHATRKIASRLVSFYDTMRTLRPAEEEFHRMSRAVAAVNGLMGSMHDVLVERRVAGVQDYHHEAFPLPEDIRARIGALAVRYRASGL